jgi:4-amino-4-deoxy-L-arabinose transferase-like glycosyltransferase
MTAPSPKPSPAAPAPPPIAGAAAAAAFPPGGADLPLPMAREVSSSAPGGRAAGRFPSTPMLLLCLAALTGLAAFLRYWRISYQGYWTDEGYTIERIRGTFDYLLTRLTDQGFPPGWYVLLRGWCLGVEKLTGDGAFAFSPASTRGLTALFGTLTVPAMYFLARQFTDRRGALLVTLLAAVNPFLIYYSRDIKMYPATWFFVVLNAGLFFKWQTTHRHWLWFVPFLVSGACMTALHSAPWFLIGLQLIWMLTRPRLRALDGPLWLTAVGLISLFPYWWFKIYLSPDRWLLRITTDANAGMGWLQRYTDMSWTTITSLSTSHLLGYLWPVYPPDNRISNWFELGPDFLQHLATRSSERMATWERDVGVAFFSILVLGLLPWRRVFRRRSAPPPGAARGGSGCGSCCRSSCWRPRGSRPTRRGTPACGWGSTPSRSGSRGTWGSSCRRGCCGWGRRSGGFRRGRCGRR